MKVLFCASEVAPFAKTGGLADVAGALPLELGALGAQVLVTMPRYRGIRPVKKRLAENVEIHFIENEELFNRASLYGDAHGDYRDNLKRFSFFCRETLAVAEKRNFRPDIVHAHDWQTALLPVLLKTQVSTHPLFKNTKSLLTVHNLAYQGHFRREDFGETGLPETLFGAHAFEFHGKGNLLKAGLVFADSLSTVSPTYAREIESSEYGCGLDGVVRERRQHLRGILNGIDAGQWDPARDKHLAKKFSVRNPTGKALCKKALQKRYGWERDAAIPIFGIVSRLAHQKGLDMLSEICDGWLSRRVQFVMLGEGDRVYHTTFRNVARRYPKNTVAHLGFDETEAHRVYAGSDFFLMPSLYEPCGLGQMIALRYGTIPIVRRTGGLADTVVDVDEHPKKGNGFVFSGKSPEQFLKAIHRAMGLFQKGKKLAVLRVRGMRGDYSWTHSAKEYMKYYREIIKT